MKFSKTQILHTEYQIISSFGNLFGPHHIEAGESYEVTPAGFFKEATIWELG